ncbi:uncharacterized protein G2W53_006224 [Senna tora]|uniref:Uncharacterized protein n=1 Tax=Senna tora TaxID=362788 RepID=A0A834X3M7_9FABA|nr:uncharacterized protein G2W53_006224 [Senna tora]
MSETETFHRKLDRRVQPPLERRRDRSKNAISDAKRENTERSN